MKQFPNPDAISEGIDFARSANISHEKAVGIGNFFLSGAGRKDLQISASTSINISHNSDMKRLKTLDNINQISSLYYDSKISKAVEKSNRPGKIDICTMITEPNTSFIGDFEPEKGDGKTVGTNLFNTIEKTNSLDSIKVIGCDGCPVNTGPFGGANATVELNLKRALSQSVCLKHFLELLPRHLVTCMDGPTTGDKSFKGKLGKEFPKMSQKDYLKSFSNFELISEAKEIADEYKDLILFGDLDKLMLNADTKFMLHMWLLLVYGKDMLKHLPKNFEKSPTGPLSFARFTTLCNAIVRLYSQTSKSKCSKVLKRLATIMCVWYIPLDLAIRLKPHVKDGIKHYFYAVKLARQFFERTEFVSKIKKSVNKRKVTYKTSEWEIAKKEFMINGFFCTVEWALFSAVVDSDTKYKEIAIKIIGQIRNHFNEKSQSEQAIPRKNILPSDFINFDSANDFWELLPIEYWANNPDLLIQYDKRKPPMKINDLYLHQPPLLGNLKF